MFERLAAGRQRRSTSRDLAAGVMAPPMCNACNRDDHPPAFELLNVKPSAEVLVARLRSKSDLPERGENCRRFVTRRGTTPRGILQMDKQRIKGAHPEGDRHGQGERPDR